MNVFLDTTVLYNDPYFRSNYNRLLLDGSKEYTYKLYISDVVIKELRKQLEKSIEKHNKQFISIRRSVSGNCKDISIYQFDQIDLDKELSYFDEFYDRISEDTDITIVGYEEEEQVILDNILKKAINRLKPFKENGEGFKDALIWESYTEYAKYREMNNCIFISANTRDFAESKYDPKKYVFNLHNDLLISFPHFLKLYKNSQDFLKSENLKSIRDSAPYWLGEVYQDDSKIYDLVFSKKHYTDIVLSSGKRAILKSDKLESEGVEFVNEIEVTSLLVTYTKILGFEEYENVDGIGCLIELEIMAQMEMNLYFRKDVSSGGESSLKFIDIYSQGFKFWSSIYVDKAFNHLEVFQVDNTEIII